MYSDILRKIGLNPLEALVYQKLLEIGPSRAQEILENIPNIKRGNLYNILRNLKDKNLVKEKQLQPRKTIFQAQSPSYLELLVDKQEKQLNLTRETFNKIFPLLESQFILSTERPGIQYLEGLGGILKVYDDVLRGGFNELLVFHAAFTDEELVGSRYYKKYLKQKAKKGIRTKVILPQTTKFSHLPCKEPRYKIARKFLKTTQFKIPCDIAIYANKVSVLVYKDRWIGFILENKNLAESMGQIFYLVWRAY